MILALVTAAAVLSAAAAIAADVLTGEPRDLASETPFVYKSGRLWARISDGRNHQLGLIDTGTSMSVFPRRWADGAPQLAAQKVASPFGNRSVASFKPGRMTIGDSAFDFAAGLMADGKFPLVGADFIFAAPRVLISKHGIRPNAEVDAAGAVQCSPLILDYVGNTMSSPLKGIYFELLVDGVSRKALLDTGRQGILAATALADAGDEKRRIKLDIRFNSLSDWKLVSYHSRESQLSLGAQSFTVKYQHFYEDKSVPAPFVIGGGFLELYSIHVDRQKGQICFFEY